MKKNLGVIILLVVAIVGAIYLFISQIQKESNKPVVTPVATSTPAVENIVLKDKKIEDKNDVAGYSISIKYPEVTGLKNGDSQLVINKEISQKIQDLITDFKKSSLGVGRAKDETSSLDVDYKQEILTTLPNIISFKISESYFEAGAAHPSQTIETFNVDTKTGKAITLESIFLPESAYLGKLSEYSVRELQNKLGTNDQIVRGAGPDADNYQAYMITDAGLRVIFNQYQVASYAAGVQEVTIPYLEIRDLISATGPLGKIVQ